MVYNVVLPQHTMQHRSHGRAGRRTSFLLFGFFTCLTCFRFFYSSFICPKWSLKENRVHMCCQMLWSCMSPMPSCTWLTWSTSSLSSFSSLLMFNSTCCCIMLIYFMLIFITCKG